MIRPVIEYGNIIWGPFYVMDQQAIEKVQHRATKIIPELRLFISGMLTAAISAIACSQTAKRGNDISIPADTPVL